MALTRWVPPALPVPPLAARRFLRRVLALDTPFADVATAVAALGYVQIDPINVCGRMHDLILRNRVANYREGDLLRHLHGETAPLPPQARTAFEHHLPDTGVLVAFPTEAWPHLLAAMRRRTHRGGPWSGRLTPREKPVAARILAGIAARGPLGPEDFDDDRRAHRTVWGSATLVKSVLQKLFFHGRLLIAQRHRNRRRYDLPERVLPAAVLARPEPPAGDTARWLALLKLKQRRLVALKRDELRAVADLVQPVTLEPTPATARRRSRPPAGRVRPGLTLYCLRTDVPQLLAAAAAPVPDPRPVRLALLAPLDPLIYDRRVTAAVWEFNYTWEAYTPAAKRVRGHYALPVLAGTELIGHVDPKADRPARRLRVISRRIRRGHTLAPALEEFSRWLGLEAETRS